MKNLKIKISYTFYTVLVAFLIVGCTDIKDTIKVGQVWKMTYNEDNPYKKATINYNEVIEITGEYLLYVKNKRDTVSEKKYWFVVGSKCVSNCN